MIPYDLPPLAMLLWLFLHGAIIGSFLTVCMHRLPRHKNIFAAWCSLIHNPSHCDHCEKKLLARDNIPIFGWLILGGRCRFCQTGIPARYPLIELANGLLFVLVYALEVPLNHWNPLSSSCLSSTLSPTNLDNAWGFSPVAFVNCRYLYHLILIEALFVASLIDWEAMQIPDSVTVAPLLAGVVLAGVFGKFWLVPVWFQDTDVSLAFYSWLPADWHPDWLSAPLPAWIGAHPHGHGLAVSLAGMLVGGGMVWTVRVIGRLGLGREVMGFGDVMLLAMVGSFVGWQPVVVAFYLAPMLALSTMLLTRRFQPDREIPYGPYLSLASVLVLLGWRWIWPSFAGYFALGPVLIVAAVLMTATLPLVLYCFRLVQLRLGIVRVVPEPAGLKCGHRPTGDLLPVNRFWGVTQRLLSDTCSTPEISPPAASSAGS